MVRPHALKQKKENFHHLAPTTPSRTTSHPSEFYISPTLLKGQLPLPNFSSLHTYPYLRRSVLSNPWIVIKQQLLLSSPNGVHMDDNPTRLVLPFGLFADICPPNTTLSTITPPGVPRCKKIGRF